MKTMAAAAVGVALLACSSLSVAQQRALQFDINNLGFQAFNSAGQSSAFGGLTHSGRLDLFEEVSLSELLSVSLRVGNGPYQIQPSFTGTLTNLAMSIVLTGGDVTGGSLTFDVNGGPGSGGDRYSATIGVGGEVTNYVGGGFKVEGLTFAGAFSDANFSGVPIADFFAAQGGAFLPGDFITFKIMPNASGAGNADTDIFVTNVPTPGSIACLGLAGLVCTRRRR
jgi:hypothetical protein